MALASISDLNGSADEISRRIEQAKQLSTKYDAFIDTEQDGHDRAAGIHASELYPCLRKAVYSILDAPRQPYVAKFWKQRFKMGKQIHLMMQDDFHRMAKATQTAEAHTRAQAMADEMDCIMEFDAEVEVHPDKQELARYYQLHSACDGIFTFRDRTTGLVVLRVGLEIKSEAPAGYEALKKPKDEHVRQAHIYMAALDLPLMWFFYMNKGNQNNTNSMAPWLVVFQPEIWKEIEDRCRTALDFSARGELPERVEGIFCQFCAWSYECKPPTQGREQKPHSFERETIRRPGA